MLKSWISGTVAIAVVLTGATGHALQVDRVGLKAGGTVSQFHEGSVWSSGSGRHVGFAGGAFVEVPVSRSVVFQPALVFVRRAATFCDRPATLTGELTVVDELYMRRDYLELPLLLRFNWAPSSKFLPAIVAGPVFGRVLSAVVTEDGADATAYFDVNGAIEMSQKGRSDFALAIGLGITRQIPGVFVGLDVVYRRGISGVDNGVPGGYFKADGFDATMSLAF